ncbi:MAG: histidine phosphatase family protein [Oscillospiraceae bacterium]|jgi:2,3-bisphosphoglycerate-dependent phosphoglycerate mutase|nr:histidine phosphatase family protein [Oscillospiraceae bacterium]
MKKGLYENNMKITKVFFIRHAESDISIRDPVNRPLTEKGVADRGLVTDFLNDKNIDVVLSSPFKRAFDTVADFAEKNGFEIKPIEDFRERKSDSKENWRDDFVNFMKQQWEDFNYSLSDGECLREVQERNISALNIVLTEYKDMNIVIGTHGTALSTIINYYDNTYGFEDFMAMVNIMPWVVKMTFDGNKYVESEKIDLFKRI